MPLTNCDPKKILICQQRQLGDVLLSTPIFRILHHRFPKAELHIFTEKKCEPLLRNNPFISSFHLIDKDKQKNIFDQIKWYYGVAKNTFDMVINFQQLPRCKMMTLFSRAPVKISYRTSFLNNLYYTHTIVEPSLYAVARKVALLKLFGIEWKQEKPEIFLLDSEKDTAKKILSEHGLGDNEFLINMDVTHRRQTKQWPLLNFAKLIDLLSVEYPQARFLLLYGPGEKESILELKKMCSSHKKLIILDEVPDIRISAAMIACAKFHLGNGSAPQHIALACGTPSLIIPGPEGPWWTYPDSMNAEIVADVSCRPCTKIVCDDMRCMNTIMPEMVFEKAKHMLDSIL